jgi:hypothetical protein
MLCALFQTSPKQILIRQLADSPDQRKAAIAYFLQRGYAQAHYPEEDITQIFHELEAKSILWPELHDNHLTPEQRHLHCLWSNMWMGYWFEKWKRRREKK